MAQPVWVLSVDLQAKTAVFKSGMADAAKSARGSFNEIKSGANEMGGHVTGNMFASRHAVMAVTESLGVQMPRAITALLVHIEPLGAALEAAFPFLAIGLAAVLLTEHLAKLKQEGVELTENQVKFGTAVQTAFNSLDQKLLQAQIRTDELKNDHLGALRHQLELINMQSLDELRHQFTEIAKESDAVFAALKTGWYSLSAGSAGAKQSLTDFQIQYDALLSKGDRDGASSLLHAKLERETKFLAMYKEAAAADGKRSDYTDEGFAAQLAYHKAVNGLKAAGLDYDEKSAKSMQELVSVLNAQVGMEQRVSKEKDKNGGNAELAEAKAANARRSEGARSLAEHMQNMGEIALGAERELSATTLALRNAGIAERLASDERLANEEYRIQLAGNKHLIDALNKSGDDYNNQLHGLQQKAEELTAQHNATLSNLEAKAREAQYREDLQNLNLSEREKIEATDQGSRERLVAIDAALKEEGAKNLQQTSFYRDLQKERIQVLRQAVAEESKQAAEAGLIAAENEQKFGELLLAGERQRIALRDSAHRVSMQRRIDEEVAASNDELALKKHTLEQEAAALDKAGKDYENKLKAIQNKERQLVREHENEVTAIKSRAEMERNGRILAAEAHFRDSIAQGLTQALMGHKSFASEMNSLGNQVVTGMMENAIKSILANDMTKESDAAKAARDAFKNGEAVPYVGMVLGPIMGAAAFTAMMAFEGGGIVPGIGRGDIVPAMLTPGEGVIPGGIMNGLAKMASSGGMGGGQTQNHMHYRPTFNVQTIDASGVQEMLDKHTKEFSRHYANELRRMNR